MNPSNLAKFDLVVLGGGPAGASGAAAAGLPPTCHLGELRKQCHINTRARSADKSADFSQLIRQGLPDPNL